MGITIETLTKVKKVFDDKNWVIDDDPLLFSSTFNRFCSRLELFDTEQQNLIIELTTRFLNLGINDYQPLFTDAIKKIPELDSYRSILVAPLKKPSLRDIKSADSILHHLRAFADFSYDSFKRKLFFTNDWEHIAKVLSTQKALLILIDDHNNTHFAELSFWWDWV